MQLPKEELIEGKTYVLDKGYSNSSQVILVKDYGKMYCRVKSTTSDDEWDTMTNRLSHVEQC